MKVVQVLMAVFFVLRFRLGRFYGFKLVPDLLPLDHELFF